MRWKALATDYDGTIADGGRVAPEVLDALARLARAGCRLVLVTGRELSDLASVCPALERFDRVVAENGAVLANPASNEVRALAEPPPGSLADALRARDVTPLSIGQVIVATREPHGALVEETLRELGLDRH